MSDNMLNFGSVRRSVLLATSIMVLLVSISSSYGSTYSSLSPETRTIVSSPPVFLQAGTNGNSVIYTSNTSARVRTAAPAPTPTYNASNYNITAGTYVDGSVPASIRDVDSNYFIVKSSATANSTTAYHPSNCSLIGNTTLVSGSTADLVSDNIAYMTLRSYATVTSPQTLYAHQETTTISGTNYYQLQTGSANQTGTTLSTSMESVGRVNFGKFVYPLTGVPSIPSSIWTIYYRTWHSTVSSEIVTLRPNAVGTYTEWTTVFPTGTPHWDAVDDTTDDGDSTYIETAISGHRDMFNLPDIPSHAIVSSVKVCANAKRTAGGASLQIGIRSGTTDSWATATSPTNSYALYNNTWNTDPNTGAAWTAAGVNAMQAGVRCNDNKGVRVTQIYVEVTATIPPVGHCNVDLLIRRSDGVIRSTIATQVANSTDLTDTAQSLFGTYSFPGYIVVNQTDYLEIDVYVDATYAKTGTSAYLRIDDNTLATTDQTRAANIVLPSEYTAEVEFTGTSNTEPWAQLVWTVDSSFTTTSVTTTFKLFNNQTGQYPTSGDGFMTDTIGTTDVTKTQTITVNVTKYRDGSGNWKIKVKAMKTATTQFDFKIDLVEFKPTYNQYTVSTEFLFTSMTKNTPTQLNFTVVSEYDIASVNVTIQVWNYSSPGYVPGGTIGYLNYTSSGPNETKNLNITANPQFYTSNGDAKIKLTGVLATTTQYQQKVNQVKLLYSYNSSPSYDYVLKIVNKVSDRWIRLRAFSQSNITRLNNCTIYFRSSLDNTARQIYIVNGAYVNQTGDWYDLPASPAERYVVVKLQANDSNVSYVHVYLEIRVPNKTTYAQYVITFEIT